MKIEEHTPHPHDFIVTRRQFLNRCGMGFGALSLAALFGQEFFGGSAATAAGNLSPLAPKQPPLPAKAKRVVHIFAQGGPSHVDTWDPKPTLTQLNGQALPGGGIALGSPFKFERKGRSGIEVSELFPNLGEHVDD